VKLLDGAARAGDAVSAKRMLDRLVAGEVREHELAARTLMAAARLLPAEEIVRILPLLREQARDERPRDGTESPPSSRLRAALLRGGCNALGWVRAEGALDDLCDFVLDPALQPAAFDGRDWSKLPPWALDAMRDFPPAPVDAAFRRALARADADGRLADCNAADLIGLARIARSGFGDDPWERGRALHEVALALFETVERLPLGEESAFDRMLALGGLGRDAEAAAAARADAARKRARGFTALDGDATPEVVEVRARFYDARAASDAKALFAAAEASGDPFLLNLAAWYLRFEVRDLELAGHAGEEAVRRSAGLHRLYRDTLAAVRNAQGRPAEALRLLDPRERVPARRPEGGRWHDVFFAEAHVQQGEELSARHALMQAAADRRVLPWIRADRAFAPFAEVFRLADESFFYDRLFPLEPED
jgi:hypothetical protein